MDVTLDSLIREVLARSEDPLDQLESASQRAAELDDLGDALLNHFVDRSRRAGHTWAEIGQHLGVTRQAAQKRFVGFAGEQVTFERFTQRAREAVTRSEAVAVELNHSYVGTEHQLLALFDVKGNLALAVLEGLGVKRAAVEKAVLEAAPRGAAPAAAPLFRTPRLRRAMEEALGIALDLRHNYIGCEHLLLGLCRGQEGLARRVLEERGATYDVVHAAVLEQLRGFKKG